MGLPAFKIGQTLISQGRHREDKFSNSPKGYKIGKISKTHFLKTIPNYATAAVDLTVDIYVKSDVLSAVLLKESGLLHATR